MHIIAVPSLHSVYRRSDFKYVQQTWINEYHIDMLCKKIIREVGFHLGREGEINTGIGAPDSWELCTVYCTNM